MSADTREAEAALDALAAAVRTEAGRRPIRSNEVVRRGTAVRRRRQGAAALATAVLVMVAVVAWRVVPAGDDGGLRSGSSGGGDPQEQLFSVRSPRPSYWRLNALDAFDGATWRSQSRFEDLAAGSPLPGDTTAGDEAELDVAVTGLDRIWLPTAGRPRRLAASSMVSSNEAGDVIVNRGSVSGVTYTLWTVFPAFDPAALRAAPATVPPQRVRDTDLPASVPAAVGDEARSVVGGAPTRYDAARSLAEHLRSRFAYDGASPDETSLERFLDERRGSSAQFASAFAVMGRSLGIPTRVVNGFVPGELGPDGRYHVRRADKHVWAEVWFEGTGWVPFDPSSRPGTTPMP